MYHFTKWQLVEYIYVLERESAHQTLQRQESWRLIDLEDYIKKRQTGITNTNPKFMRLEYSALPGHKEDRELAEGETRHLVVN
jgi:hypothetical protein